MIYPLKDASVIQKNYIDYSVSSPVVPRFVIGVAENYSTVLKKMD